MTESRSEADSELVSQPKTEKPSAPSPRGLVVMCLLALAVGVIGGLGAWGFRMLIGFFHNLFFLGKLQFAYDANLHTDPSPWGVGIIIVPVIGALIVTWLVKSFAPEAKGHGVPEVMDAIYYNGGNIRPIVAIVKSLASAICIGSGGSVGREGPIVQIGSAFGSTLGQIVQLPARQRITLVAAGSAAGIAATFNAPLGGIVFAIELLLVSVNVRNLLPVAIATVTATYIGQAMLGTKPAFDVPPLQVNHFELGSPWMLLLFIPFGIVMGLAAAAFVRGVYWTEDRFETLTKNEYLRHAAGMLIVGIMSYLLIRSSGHYYVAGIGYATIMDTLTAALIDPLFLLLLCGLKLAAVCLTLGSGGSGGVFSPALFLGATLGAAFANGLQWVLPDIDVNVVSFVVAGMAASVGASTGAFVTASVMLQEMTDDNNVILPVVVTTIVACGVRNMMVPASVYTLKLIRRGHVVPEGLEAALDDARNVSHVMTSEYEVVDEQVDTAEPIRVVTLYARDGEIARIVDPFGRSRRPESKANSQHDFVMVGPDQPLVAAMRAMRRAGTTCAIVSTTPSSLSIDNVVGVLTYRELSLYRTAFADLLS